jgi:hypothetical protein
VLVPAIHVWIFGRVGRLLHSFEGGSISLGGAMARAGQYAIQPRIFDCQVSRVVNVIQFRCATLRDWK